MTFPEAIVWVVGILMGSLTLMVIAMCVADAITDHKKPRD